MTLQQQVEGALERAQWCRSRRKNSGEHFKEATHTVGLMLARENQSRGCHYTQALLTTLRGPRRAKPRHDRQLSLEAML